MGNKIIINIEGLISIFFLIAVFFKQFYIFESGSIQVGDVFFTIAFIIGFVFKVIKISKIDHTLILFVLSTFFINGIYYMYYGSGFVLQSLYLLFNLLVVLVFRVLIKKKSFILWFSNVLKLNLTIQSIIFITGYGRYLGYRYQGTFNDPNQFSFFILMNFFLLFFCNFLLKKSTYFLWYMVTLLNVLFSVSSGMIMAYGIFLIFAFLLPRLNNKDFLIKIIVITLSMLIIFVITLNWDDVLLLLKSTFQLDFIDSITYRITGKVDKFQSYEGILGFMKDRLLLRCIEAPYYFLYGCGEGLFERFIPISGESNEMHSTIIGLFYYYGFLPFCLLFIWMKDNLKQLPIEAYGCVIAVLIESLTLVNHRQPFFWMLFVLGRFLFMGYSSSCEKNQIMDRGNIHAIKYYSSTKIHN